MNGFVKMFEECGFIVEPFDTESSSYIAYNGTFCVPFTVHGNSIAAVSFLADDKDAIKEHYRKRNDRYIGSAAFTDVMNDRQRFYHIGRLCNHDYAGYEIASWLAQFKK